MERSVTEELLDILKKKNTDYIRLSTLPDGFMKRLGLAKSPKVSRIAAKLSPHLGNDLVIKNVAASKYLALKLPDEVLLCRIVEKNNGKIPRMDRIPFRKDDFFHILNQLIEKGAARHTYVKTRNDYSAVISFEEDSSTPPAASEGGFKAAYQALERGKSYVRICDMRRYLNWTVQEFDEMLTGLRDSGRIHLEDGAPSGFTEEDIRDSFIDESEFRRLIIVWRE